MPLELRTLLSGKMLEGLLAVPSATTVAWPEQNPIDVYPTSARCATCTKLAEPSGSNRTVGLD
jgi:hypothetical protein